MGGTNYGTRGRRSTGDDDHAPQPHLVAKERTSPSASAADSNAAATYVAATGGSSTAAGPRGRLVATLQRSASRGTREGATERPSLPETSSRATGITAAAAAALLESAPATAASYAEPHGNLGASDSGTEAAGPPDLRPDAATSARPAPPGPQGH